MSRVPYAPWRDISMIAIAIGLWVLLAPCLAFAKCSDDMREVLDTVRKKMVSMIEADRNQREYASLSNALTPNQKNEVSEALRALRKMVAITEAGLNQREYASRVLDMVATVDESLRHIPDSQLKTKILLAKDAYVTANSGWSDSLRITCGDLGESIKIFVQAMWKIGGRNLKEADILFQTGRLNP